MIPATADNLLQLAAELELVPPGELQDAHREAGGHALDAAAFGQVLVRRELLTGFQLERLLRGEREGYFYGRAKVLYQIGAGSFARVFRAIHRDTGAIYAVKVLRKRFGNDAEKRASFQREGEMGRLLRHPNIVAIEDVGQEHGASYITMEFVEGQTLRELVKIRGAIDVPRALAIITQAFAGLEYAHRRGVTHRDLKASNVIVSSTGTAKLVDFGLANVDATGDRGLDRAEQPRTVDYAALEKCTGMRGDDVRSDIYFLGTIAYLALAGGPALPESRDRAARSDTRRFTGVVPLAERAPQLPRDVVDVVSRMMHLDPLQRYQTAADARRAVEKVAARLTTDDGAARPAPQSAVDAADAPPAGRGSLMVVEPAQRDQEALREFFTRLGYRVLMTGNPQRALARFATQPPPADCLVISARSLGVEAVEAFNALAADPFLAPLPAVLLVGQRQEVVFRTAREDGLRRVVAMPVQADAMQRLLGELVARPG